MSEYGPTKKEKWKIASDLLGITLGSAATALLTVSFLTQSILFVIGIVPSLGIVILTVILLYLDLEQISLRIRIEESQRHSELIDEILAIYKGEK